MLIRSGPHQPLEMKEGSYTKFDASDPDSVKPTFTDVFNEKWISSSQGITDKGLAVLNKSIIPDLNDLYRGHDLISKRGYNFLSNDTTITNQTIFISVKENAIQSFARTFVKYFFNNENQINITSGMPYY